MTQLCSIPDGGPLFPLSSRILVGFVRNLNPNGEKINLHQLKSKPINLQQKNHAGKKTATFICWVHWRYSSVEFTRDWGRDIVWRLKEMCWVDDNDDEGKEEEKERELKSGVLRDKIVIFKGQRNFGI